MNSKMICKNCGWEHPEDQIANPHYCIARMGEQIDAMEREIFALKGLLGRHGDVTVSKEF